jgi:hypothetical protein
VRAGSCRLRLVELELQFELERSPGRHRHVERRRDGHLQRVERVKRVAAGDRL